MWSGRLAEPSQIVSSEIQLCVELEVAWPRVRTAATLKLLDIEGCPDTFKGPSGQLHRNQLFWLDNCMESSWASSRNLLLDRRHEMRHCPYYLKTQKKTEILLKSNRYIKCFCQPECCQYKILTNSPFGHSGTKKTWLVWKYISGPKIKNTPHFCHKRTKGKHSIREKPLV